jgi:hypothetical protein
MKGRKRCCETNNVFSRELADMAVIFSYLIICNSHWRLVKDVLKIVLLQRIESCVSHKFC